MMTNHIPARLFFFLVLASATSAAMAGNTLGKVRSYGLLRCGVSQDLAGFAWKDSGGQWRGLNVDFCRAIAAATLGDADKVKFVPLSASARFAPLLSGQIDVLAHTATQTFGREAEIGLEFAGFYYLDGQTFLVPRKAKASQLEDLNGATVCVQKGTTSETVLPDVFQQRQLKYQAMVIESLADFSAAFFAGRCQALLSERSTLAAILSTAPGGPEKYEILSQGFSKEPMGPVVRRGDEAWLTLVRWVLFALIEAEETGVTRENVRSLRAQDYSPDQRRLLVDSGRLGANLGLSPGWVGRMIAAVGNYEEIYERNLGNASPLKIDRKYNRLWKNGGLLFSPPFR